MPRIGDIVPIKCQLYDGDQTVYVLAIILDDAQNPVGASPYAVPHLTSGLYALNNIVMPDTEYLTVTFKVYEDAVFSSPSTKHGDTVDIFFKEEADPEVILKLDQIIALLNTITTGATVVGNQIVGEVNDVNLLVGTVEEDYVSGTIDGTNELVGIIEDNDMSGSISEPFVTGDAECK